MTSIATLRRLSWTLLLPVLLLFSQQGELFHEYSHYGQPPASQKQKKAPADSDHCPQCLAYAQLSGAAANAVTAPTLLSGLAFHFAAAFVVAGVNAEVVAARSRGPPPR